MSAVGESVRCVPWETVDCAITVIDPPALTDRAHGGTGKNSRRKHLCCGPQGDAMNEADFAALNEHLEELRPIFDAFCARHRFVYGDRKSLGRYPRIRIEKTGATKIWFDLWMECDKEGQRFE